MSTTLTWLVHSAWRLQTAGTTLLIDPFFTGNPAAATTVDEVAADFIVITHGHGDHIGDAAAIARRTGALVISNFEIIEWLAPQGVQRGHAMNIGGAHSFPFGDLKLTIAHHSSMLPDGSSGGNPCGLLIRLSDGQKIYHAGDTGLFYDMKLIGEAGIDLAILPIGDNFTMGPDDAIRAVQLIGPRRVVPTHFNTWSLIAQDAAAWAARVRSETVAEPVVLAPGASLSL